MPCPFSKSRASPLAPCRRPQRAVLLAATSRTATLAPLLPFPFFSCCLSLSCSLSQVRPCRSRKEEAAIAKLLPCAPGSAIPGSSALDSRSCAKSSSRSSPTPAPSAPATSTSSSSRNCFARPCPRERLRLRPPPRPSPPRRLHLLRQRRRARTSMAKLRELRRPGDPRPRRTSFLRIRPRRRQPCLRRLAKFRRLNLPASPWPPASVFPALRFRSGVVRIRSTTPFCLLHGLVLLPCGISGKMTIPSLQVPMITVQVTQLSSSGSSMKILFVVLFLFLLISSGAQLGRSGI
ncbi:hypothetical protein VPH35_061322 [Triticum aestivum]